MHESWMRWRCVGGVSTVIGYGIWVCIFLGDRAYATRTLKSHSVMVHDFSIPDRNALVGKQDTIVLSSGYPDSTWPASNVNVNINVLPKRCQFCILHLVLSRKLMDSTTVTYSVTFCGIKASRTHRLNLEILSCRLCAMFALPVFSVRSSSIRSSYPTQRSRWSQRRTRRPGNED